MFMFGIQLHCPHLVHLIVPFASGGLTIHCTLMLGKKGLASEAGGSEFVGSKRVPWEVIISIVSLFKVRNTTIGTVICILIQIRYILHRLHIPQGQSRKPKKA